ncbi:uncharacterized protein LACBIDRAFT_323219 [Laccaria bicolor S238N-H82]|uniref:Predicted protein n=1 Tax=Laccaria bicolor (strain S238N-H82 / ATCC MYA-4686) TaxID=486041 RepID=B0CZH7_LACBS|nr:uncharacterized protein LACBIDRAFT_323219 [Laccaria bicolor S238N-H82]EDR12626.1 predicted protein [Laccaria bicolor S238N-H82]|eukprot:XP_001876890.1 predicted protein [Laccaria bicolor S238N-H82]
MVFCTLIKNKDQDSGVASTGTSDSHSMVTFQPNYPPVDCQRSCLKCRGSYSCSQADPELLRAERFLSIIQWRCGAVDGTGKQCNGRPKMQPKPNGPSQGHTCFITCSGWLKTFKEKHQTFPIPDDMDEDVLSQLLNGSGLSQNSDTVSSHVHIVNGNAVRSLIVNHACPSKRGLYTPPHIPVGLQMDSGRLQMDYCCSSSIFSNFFFGGNPAKSSANADTGFGVVKHPHLFSSSPTTTIRDLAHPSTPRHNGHPSHHHPRHSLTAHYDRDNTSTTMWDRQVTKQMSWGKVEATKTDDEGQQHHPSWPRQQMTMTTDNNTHYHVNQTAMSLDAHAHGRRHTSKDERPRCHVADSDMATRRRMTTLFIVAESHPVNYHDDDGRPRHSTWTEWSPDGVQWSPGGVQPENIPHNHPMPPMAKASIEVKVAYQECIEAVGSAGVTVQKVDNAPSTKLLLRGKEPGQYNSALNDKQVKQDILHANWMKKNPAGMGIPGVFNLFHQEFLKQPSERYIHNIVTTEKGKTLIFTGVPFLMSLIHEVSSFKCDTTFKHIKDSSGINEWEMVIYYPQVQQETDHYECLFNDLQKHILAVTSKKMCFKRFSKGGNLSCLNADMEAVQVLGAAKSFMKTNEPNFSGILADVTPEDFATYFVHLCLTHIKKGILDFKSLVSVTDYQQLMDFPYLASIEELENFTAFVAGLKIDWESIPATMNIGEGQHHWTNQQSGIKLPLVEAILTYIKNASHSKLLHSATLETGIKSGSQTDLVHCMTHKIQCQTATTQKAHESGEAQDLAQALASEVEAEKENRRKSLACGKELRAQLKELKTGRGKKSKTPAKAHMHGVPCSPLPNASSSGRVRTVVNHQHSSTCNVKFEDVTMQMNLSSDLMPCHFLGGIDTMSDNKDFWTNLNPTDLMLDGYTLGFLGNDPTTDLSFDDHTGQF